ncbi:MAG: NAD(P)-dependent oxidoreductase, partial [Bryobacteraceae bacterium]
MKVAFIGIGKMGAGMARNLVRAGHDVAVYNRTIEKARAIEGARVAETPGDACQDCEVAITMLADDAAVEAVIQGESGIAAALPRNSIHISSSTIGTAL